MKITNNFAVTICLSVLAAGLFISENAQADTGNCDTWISVEDDTYGQLAYYDGDGECCYTDPNTHVNTCSDVAFAADLPSNANYGGEDIFFFVDGSGGYGYWADAIVECAGESQPFENEVGALHGSGDEFEIKAQCPKANTAQRAIANVWMEAP